MPDISYRSRKTEFRAETPADGQPYLIEGYFVVFNQPYYVDDYCEEVIDRHAFDNAVMNDVRALIDHNSRLVLGRRNETVQTLEFEIDDTGVYGRIQVNPDDTDAMSLRARVLRGDVDQASFGFIERRWEYEDLPDGRVRRTVLEIAELLELTVCTFPAYEQTSVSARSRNGDALRKEVLKHRKNNLRRKLKYHEKQTVAHQEALHEG